MKQFMIEIFHSFAYNVLLFVCSNSDSPCQDAFGESDLTPGKSLVFGVLEICMCVLTKQLSGLLPSSAASNQQPVMLVAIGSNWKCMFLCLSDSLLKLM